ncbi:MAG TPA: hypothetical protein VMU39_23260 [Solirubrobacteraceae bacterium]|nr:hypothetical protein [Solirubrobacteraceae bacterium]
MGQHSHGTRVRCRQLGGLQSGAEQLGNEQLVIGEVLARAVEGDSHEAAGRAQQAQRELVLDLERAEEVGMQREAVKVACADGVLSRRVLRSPAT